LRFQMLMATEMFVQYVLRKVPFRSQKKLFDAKNAKAAQRRKEFI